MAWTTKYDHWFREAAKESDLDWLALKAQACQESSLDPLKVSPAGAVGLMQFMPLTWGDWIPWEGAERTDPKASIFAGARYMRWLLNRLNDDLTLARIAYNWGIGNLENHLQRHGALMIDLLPDEAAEYVPLIKLHYRKLRIQHSQEVQS